jgi:hypothetical protein
MNVLGKAHFTDDQVKRFTIAHRPPPEESPLPARIRITKDNVVEQWQFGYVILPLAIVAAAMRWSDRRTWMLLLAAGFVFLIWIGFTHLLGRFLIMLVPIGGLLIARVHWKSAWPGAILLLLLSTLSWPDLYGRLAHTTRDPARQALIGRQNLAFLVPDELADMSADERQVGLVGDAGAFLYQIPMSRLHYRTVFDVTGSGNDPVNAWEGPQAKGDRNWLLVIHPAEIERLHTTYWGIPSLPSEWADRHEPFVIHGESLKK